MADLWPEPLSAVLCLYLDQFQLRVRKHEEPRRNQGTEGDDRMKKWQHFVWRSADRVIVLPSERWVMWPCPHRGPHRAALLLTQQAGAEGRKEESQWLVRPWVTEDHRLFLRYCISLASTASRRSTSERGLHCVRDCLWARRPRMAEDNGARAAVETDDGSQVVSRRRVTTRRSRSDAPHGNDTPLWAEVSGREESECGVKTLMTSLMTSLKVTGHWPRHGQTTVSTWKNSTLGFWREGKTWTFLVNFSINIKFWLETSSQFLKLGLTPQIKFDLQKKKKLFSTPYPHLCSCQWSLPDSWIDYWLVDWLKSPTCRRITSKVVGKKRIKKKLQNSLVSSDEDTLSLHLYDSENTEVIL